MEHNLAMADWVTGDPMLGRTPSDVERRIDIDALFHAHHVRLTRLASTITLDRSVAEDIVQEAFSGLHRRAGGVHNPEGYLQRSVVNLGIKVQRRRRTAANFRPDPPPVAGIPEIDETWAAVRRLPARQRAMGRAAVLGRPQRGRHRRRARLAGRNREVHIAPGARPPEEGDRTMNTHLDNELTDNELDNRLRTTFATMMPLLDAPSASRSRPGVDRTDDTAVEFTSDRYGDVAFDPDAPSSSPGRTPRLILAAAACVALVAGLAVAQNIGTETPAVSEQPTPATPDPAQPQPTPESAPDFEVAAPVASVDPICSDTSSNDGCAAFAELPVVDGASDFYVGPESLGTPTVAAPEDFESLLRCTTLDEAGTACAEIEGFAGVGSVTYSGSDDPDVTVDTSGGLPADALDVRDRDDLRRCRTRGLRSLVGRSPKCPTRPRHDIRPRPCSRALQRFDPRVRRLERTAGCARLGAGAR